MDREEVIELMRSSERYPFNLESQEYEPVDSDVFVCAWPKCGQTWTLNIVWSLLHNGEPLEAKGYQKNWFELCSLEGLKNLPQPRMIKTHLPLHSLPFSSPAKFIYVTRNPKDAVVSYFHHQIGIGRYEGEHEFDRFWVEHMQEEMRQKGPFGSYFHHNLSFLNERDSSNFCILVYENMRQDPAQGIRQVADFLGIQLTDELLEKTLKNSSLERMKKQKWVPNSKEEDPDHKTSPWKRNDMNFIREGSVSGWRKLVTKEISDKIDQLIEKHFAGTPAEYFWPENVLKY